MESTTSKLIKGNHFDYHNFFDLKVSNFFIEELDSKLELIIKNNNKIGVFGYSLGYIAEFNRQPELFNMINDCDLMLVDGRYFYLLLRWFGYQISYEMSIPQFVRYILEFANKYSCSLMLIGATKEINIKASQNIHKSYPNIKIYDGIDGYYNDDETSDIVNRIGINAPNILLIGMSSPKKEKFYFTSKDSLNSNIIVPCGGMIDVLAGKVVETPRILKKLGLATIIRVLQEPKRMLILNLWYTYHLLFVLLPRIIFDVKVKNKMFSFKEFYKL